MRQIRRGLDQMDIAAAREGLAARQLKELAPEGIKPKRQRGLGNMRIRGTMAEHLLPLTR